MADKLPPVPRGYRYIPVVLSTSMTVHMLSCDRCGGLVLLTRTHNDWHKKNNV